MNFYLDDCADDDDLVALLSQKGHNVYTPRSKGTSGADDPDHLDYAAAHGYTLITKNPKDFRNLHNDYQAQGRPHSGIFLIYQDNLKGKDMEPPDIVCAIGNLLASGIPIANEVHVLNHWR
jgi:predicted nuclease of predicted toxin-antitoxin system